MYHLTSRGNGGLTIYLDDQDREVFLAQLASVVNRFKWLLYAYCLMDNHYHLLVETPGPNLSLGMRQLNGTYTQRFNRRHNRPGHVFQGRYKAILVEKESYFLELVRYIVLNPIRIRVIEDIQIYAWSSYRATAGLNPTPSWLRADSVLSHFGITKAPAQRRYIDFVKAGVVLPTIWDDLRQQIYLGSDQFVGRMQKHVSTKSNVSEVPRAQRQSPAKPLDFYANAYNNALQAMVAAYQTGHYSLAAIGRYFGVHYSTVSRAIKTAEQRS